LCANNDKFKEDIVEEKKELIQELACLLFCIGLKKALKERPKDDDWFERARKNQKEAELLNSVITI
jgi:hypothetical protein